MCDSSTFLQHWCPENIVKQRFHDQNVRQFYVFATLMSGKHRKTTISKMKTREALAFLTVRKMKTREALTFLTVFNQKWRFRARVVQFLNQKAARERGTPDDGFQTSSTSLPSKISPSRAHTQLRIARTNETKRFPGKGLTNADNTPQPPI